MSTASILSRIFCLQFAWRTRFEYVPVRAHATLWHWRCVRRECVLSCCVNSCHKEKQESASQLLAQGACLPALLKIPTVE